MINTPEEESAIERDAIGACGRRPFDGRLRLHVTQSGEKKAIPCDVCQRVCPNRNQAALQEETIVPSPSA